jgi:succinate dehydrogenase / fumarate reductase flavoprotein subunit
MLEAQMLDISSSRWMVALTAHYSMGGVVVDPETTATEIEGLYAAGDGGQRSAWRQPAGW